MLDRVRSPKAFRPARAEDASRLHAIREAAFAPVFSSFETQLGPKLAPVVMPHIRAGQAAQFDAYLRGTPGVSVHALLSGGDLAGFCTLAVDRATRVGEIGLNAVHPTFQGRGLGRWMYDRALDTLRAEGMAVASVGTGADDAHAAAVAAYGRAGFVAGIAARHLYRPL